ncbi:helix-turn-helix transcriptional regulator [Paraflavitalea devenefica]|uniref:helix-turn-helix transcriptional regulator n=1 Tax=Paraflavitalea devenefica TaxID=2716334 RepID=UPI00141F355B|nr:helix-turn-helix transcriptional regulator [Paraflavitalea devenefica]
MAVVLSKEDLHLKKQITARLKELRESTGKNQVDFAYDIGLDKQALNRIEKGNGATLYTILKYCKYFGMSFKDFFDSDLFKGIGK